MKISFDIEGSEEQVSRFFERFVGKERAGELIEALGENDLIDTLEAEEHWSYEVFGEVNWATRYLCHLIKCKGEPDLDSNRCWLSYKALGRYGISERGVVARLGGHTKVLKRLRGEGEISSSDSVISMRKVRGEKRCYFNSDCDWVLDSYLEENQDEYSDWMLESALVDPEEIEEDIDQG